jgi:predicted nucleic-acid-binding protein
VRAIDTNILVRLAGRDDPDQLETAYQLIAEDFLVLPTVVLETEWVLRSSFGMDREEITGELRDVFGLATANFVSGKAIFAALANYETGADFGDALHAFLAAEAGATNFATFDQGVGKQLSQLPIAVETLA